jgi:hypothetical protein
MEITSQQYDCSTKGHIGKVLKEGYNLIDGQMIFKVELFGCTKCDATSPEPWIDWGIADTNPDHIDSEFCNCFGCKAKTLQLSPGDAAGNKAMSAKKWNAELNLYKSAREQGIQPAGTATKQVQKAIDDSNKVGKAYDANTNSFKG